MYTADSSGESGRDSVRSQMQDGGLREVGDVYQAARQAKIWAPLLTSQTLLLLSDKWNNKTNHTRSREDDRGNIDEITLPAASQTLLVFYSQN